MQSFVWFVTHHQYLILNTTWSSPHPVTVLYENGSKSEGSCTQFIKTQGLFGCNFPLEPKARSIDNKTTKTSYRVELAPTLCVVQFQILSGKPPDKEVGMDDRVHRAAGWGPRLGECISKEGSEEQRPTTCSTRLELTLLVLLREQRMLSNQTENSWSNSVPFCFLGVGHDHPRFTTSFCPI